MTPAPVTRASLAPSVRRRRRPASTSVRVVSAGRAVTATTTRTSAVKVGDIVGDIIENRCRKYGSIERASRETD